MQLLTLIFFTTFHILAVLRANVTGSEGGLLRLREVPILLFNQQSQPHSFSNHYVSYQIALPAVDIVNFAQVIAQYGVAKVI